MDSTEQQINENAINYINHIKEVSKEKKPLVVIHCITYNHEAFIRDALEGFVMQKTTFPFVAVVHDDASTDNTAKVLQEYAKKYPEIILPIFEKENQYSNPNGKLGAIMNMACEVTNAKYIAMCEGDDYWTDPLKLQKQVDFLESHPEYSFICHRFSIYDERSKDWRYDYAFKHYKEGENLEIDLELFLKIWVTQPLTVMIRKSSLDEYESFSSQFKYFRDVHQFYYLLSKGKGLSLNDNMGIYRWHNGGIAKGESKKERIKTSYLIFKELYFKTKDKKLLKTYLNFITQYYLIEDNNELRNQLFKEAMNITSSVNFIKNILRRKMIWFLRKIGILSEGTYLPPTIVNNEKS